MFSFQVQYLLNIYWAQNCNICRLIELKDCGDIFFSRATFLSRCKRKSDESARVAATGNWIHLQMQQNNVSQWLVAKTFKNNVPFFLNKRTHLIKLTKVDWPFYSIEVTIEQANAKLIEKGEHLCNAINHFRTYFIFTLRWSGSKWYFLCCALKWLFFFCLKWYFSCGKYYCNAD